MNTETQPIETITETEVIEHDPEIEEESDEEEFEIPTMDTKDLIGIFFKIKYIWARKNIHISTFFKIFFSTNSIFLFLNRQSEKYIIFEYF